MRAARRCGWRMRRAPPLRALASCQGVRSAGRGRVCGHGVGRGDTGGHRAAAKSWPPSAGGAFPGRGRSGPLGGSALATPARPGSVRTGAFPTPPRPDMATASARALPARPGPPKASAFLMFSRPGPPKASAFLMLARPGEPTATPADDPGRAGEGKATAFPVWREFPARGGHVTWKLAR